MGVIHHVVGEHEWAEGQCNHGPLVETESEKTFLEKDSLAHDAIRSTVLDPRFLMTLRHYVNFRFVCLSTVGMLFWYILMLFLYTLNDTVFTGTQENWKVSIQWC